VFSCAPYDSEDTAKFAAEYFKAKRYNLHVAQRR
jgi:hypothetical protein